MEALYHRFVLSTVVRAAAHKRTARPLAGSSSCCLAALLLEPGPIDEPDVACPKIEVPCKERLNVLCIELELRWLVHLYHSAEFLINSLQLHRLVRNECSI